MPQTPQPSPPPSLTLKQSIQTLCSILNSLSIPLTPQLIRLASQNSSTPRIHDLLIESVYIVLLCDACHLWMLPQLRERIQVLQEKDKQDYDAAMHNKLRYIRCKLQKMKYASVHHVTAVSSPRLKLLCLSWILLKCDAFGWYVRRVTEGHAAKVKVGLYEWDLDEAMLNEGLVNEETKAETHGKRPQQGSKDANLDSSTPQFNPTPAPPLDLTQMPLEFISKILISFVRKIYFKGRFLLGHAKAMALLHDETQKRAIMGQERLIYTSSPKEIALSVLPHYATQFEQHIQSMRFLTDVYVSISRFYQWMDKIVTEEKLQSSGTMSTLDLDLRELKEQMRRFDGRSVESLLQRVKEMHEELLIEAEERRDESQVEEDAGQQPALWWPQVHQYERYLRETGMDQNRGSHSSAESSSSTGAPFHLKPPYEHQHVILQKNPNVTSGVAVEIKRLESILQKVEQRLDQLRDKHHEYLGSLSKATVYEPI